MEYYDKNHLSSSEINIQNELLWTTTTIFFNAILNKENFVALRNTHSHLGGEWQIYINVFNSAMQIGIKILNL